MPWSRARLHAPLIVWLASAPVVLPISALRAQDAAESWIRTEGGGGGEPDAPPAPASPSRSHIHVQARRGDYSGAVTNLECVGCHRPERAPAGFWPAGRPPAETRIAAAPGAIIDEASRGCLTCHASHAAGAIAARDGRRWSHPVGVPYRAGDGYRDASDVLALGFILPGGRVACITCHDPHAANVPGLLRASGGRWGCSGCHLK